MTAALALGIARPAAADAPAITDLGTLPGDTDSNFSGMNDAGTIIGQSYSGLWYSATASHAVRWSPDGTISQLALPVGDTDAFGTTVAINDTGVIVGYSSGGGVQHPLRWDPSGTVTALPLLPGDTAAYPVALASDGTAIGNSSSRTGAQHAVRWNSDGTVTNLAGVGGDTYAYATAINDDDTAVGYSYSSGGTAHAIRWAPDGTATGLAALASCMIINDAGTIGGWGPANHGALLNPDGSTVDLGLYASVAAINAGGTTVGGYRPDIKARYGARWAPDGTVTYLPPLPGGPTSHADTNSWAAAINDAGTIVGTSSIFVSPYNEQVHAVRWAPGGSVTALGMLPGGTFSGASAINTTGTIAGSSETSTGHLHAVVWRG